MVLITLPCFLCVPSSMPHLTAVKLAANLKIKRQPCQRRLTCWAPTFKKRVCCRRVVSVFSVPCKSQWFLNQHAEAEHEPPPTHQKKAHHPLHVFTWPRVYVFMQIYTATPCLCPFLDFLVEIQLDSSKQSQMESVRRTLFLDSQQPSLVKTFSLANGHRQCHDIRIYLRVSQSSSFIFSIFRGGRTAWRSRNVIKYHIASSFKRMSTGANANRHVNGCWFVFRCDSTLGIFETNQCAWCGKKAHPRNRFKGQCIPNTSNEATLNHKVKLHQQSWLMLLLVPLQEMWAGSGTDQEEECQWTGRLIKWNLRSVECRPPLMPNNPFWISITFYLTSISCLLSQLRNWDGVKVEHLYCLRSTTESIFASTFFPLLRKSCHAPLKEKGEKNKELD